MFGLSELEAEFRQHFSEFKAPLSDKDGSSVTGSASAISCWRDVFEVAYKADALGQCFFQSFAFAVFGHARYYPIIRGLVYPMLYEVSEDARKRFEDHSGQGYFSYTMNQLFCLRWNQFDMQQLYCVLASFFNVNIVIVDMRAFTALRIGPNIEVAEILGLPVQCSIRRTVYLALHNDHFNGKLRCLF